MEKLKRILSSAEKDPVLINSTSHTYNDLFVIVEQITRIQHKLLHTLFREFIPENHWKTIISWAKQQKTVCMRIDMKEKSTFIRKEAKYIRQTETFVEGFKQIFTEQKKIHYYWDHEVTYVLSLFKGTYIDEKIQLFSCTKNMESVTFSEYNPRKAENIIEPIDILLDDFLMKYFTNEGEIIEFEIKENTETPNKNIYLEQELIFLNKLLTWNNELIENFERITNTLFNFKTVCVDSTLPNYSYPIVMINKDDESKKFQFLSKNEEFEINKDFIEFLQSHFMKIQKIDDNFKFTKFLAIIVLFSSNLQNYFDNLEYIHEIQHDNLIHALGRHVNIEDMNDLMNFHYRSFFKNEFQPKSFSYTIKSSDIDDSEGEISILPEYNQDNTNLPCVIKTFVKKISSNTIMKINLTPSIQISMNSSKYCHGWINEQFSTFNKPSVISNYKLIGRSKQFSSYILILGNVLSNDHIECKHAILLRNNTEIIIPLLMESLPSAKAFKEAISSLSLEQQEFANAYRSMQLAGSLFIVCFLPVQPQIEKILNLPPFSLTKELELMENILNILQKYQISSDLLSYNGPNNENTKNKILKVKENVENILLFIKEEQEELIKEEKRKKQLQRENDSTKINEKYDLNNSSILYASIYDIQSKDFIVECKSNKVQFSMVDKIIEKVADTMGDQRRRTFSINE